MRYLTKPKYRIYVQGYGFLSLARTFGEKYGKKLMDTATKTGIDPVKTAKATGDLIGNKIADQITLLRKTKSAEKEDERQETYTPPEKRQLLTI